MALPRPSRSARALPALVLALLLALSGAPVAAAASPTPEAQNLRGPGVGWKADPVASGKASTQPCASVLFVGVRGSGEEEPYGKTITGVRDGLAARWEGRGSVRQVWLDYPAVDPHTLQNESLTRLLFDEKMPSTKYFDSAATGASRLVSLLREQGRRCPSEWVVLAGYSQGAQAITSALSQTDVSARLAGAILAGNPSHYPGQNVQELSGSAPLTSIGLASLLYDLRARAARVEGSRDDQVKELIQATIDLHNDDQNLAELRSAMKREKAVVPASAYPATYSICQEGDPVCDAAPAMTRILTIQSTWEQELRKASSAHAVYTPEVLKTSLNATANRMNAVARADAKGNPVPRGQQVDVTVNRWGPAQIGVAMAAGVAGLLIGLGAATLRGRRRRAVSGRAASKRSKRH